MIELKRCTKCGEAKPGTAFGKHARNSDGLQYWCNACKKAWYAANSERIKEYESARRAANPEIIRARIAKWKAANPGKIRAANAAWRAANLEKAKATVAAWGAANPEARRIIKQNRRARKREGSGKLSKGLAGKLFRLQRGKCACCGKPLGDDFHLDHIMPLALGGTNTDDNIQLLTATCNMQKNAKHPIEFMRQRGFLI